MKQAQNARQQRGRSSSRQGGKSNRGSGNHRNEQQIRGNPKQLVEKYKNQARECLQAGDRMQAEYYFQFAEHYYRVVNEKRDNAPNQGDRDNQQQNNRRNRAQGGDNAGADDQQGDNQQRRGRRGRSRDDQQKTSGGDQQENSSQANGAAEKGDEAKAVKGANNAQVSDAQPADQSDQTNNKTDNSQSPIPDTPGENAVETTKSNAPEHGSSDVPPKPARRRAPRKASIPVEETAVAAPLDPTASDLS